MATQVAKTMSCESIYYVGDTKRCPYGPRDLRQVQQFSQEIALWLKDKGAKLIIIACNTATAAALDTLSQSMDIPVVGVVRPGAAGAVAATKTKRIGVLATQGTVDSGIYEKEIHKILPEAKVVQSAAPKFVELVEHTLAQAAPDADMPELFDTSDVLDIVKEYTQVLVEADVDTVVLGCTHFPVLAKPIQKVLGDHVVLVNPASLAAVKAKEVLADLGDEMAVGSPVVDSAPADPVAVANALAGAATAVANAPAGVAPVSHTEDGCVDIHPVYRFATTADDIDLFSRAASRIFPYHISSVEHISLQCLESYDKK